MKHAHSVIVTAFAKENKNIEEIKKRNAQPNTSIEKTKSKSKKNAPRESKKAK